MFLVPRLGLIRTSLLCGILNAAVALWGTYLLRPLLNRRGLSALRGRAALVIVMLAIAFYQSEALTTLAEESVLGDPIVHAETTAYQRIVLTKSERGFQLYLNGHLQFNSSDEYRYHESLVHPALSPLKTSPRHVLVLGGGDGLAVREILRYPSIESVTLVDIDPGMTTLADRFPPLAKLSASSLRDRRVTVINADAFVWIGQQTSQRFDAAIIDFPDPGTFSIGKLYTTRFYRLLRERLSADALITVQCTSPLVAPKSFWCIVSTMESAGFHVRPYHATVPTFGEWGYVLATTGPLPTELQLSSALTGSSRFLDDKVLNNLFELPRDMQRVKTEINQLNNQMLVHYYEQEWGS